MACKTGFYSKGKFLITGEYLILEGALALATPLKYGQSLRVTKNREDHLLFWRTYIGNKLWFESLMDVGGLKIISASDTEKADKLHKLLVEADRLNPSLLSKKQGFEVITEINFNIDWGLGSSSSLTSNVACLFDVDPMQLHFMTSVGSGYDVACARAESPILFQRHAEMYNIIPVDFRPPFRDQIFFVYLGNKQRSDESIKIFMSNLRGKKTETRSISDLTMKLVGAKSLNDFEDVVREHEEIIGSVLGTKPIAKSHFPEFDGTVKSLGAWGGDFAMMTWKGSRIELQNWLTGKGYPTVFAFDEIIYPPKHPFNSASRRSMNINILNEEHYGIEEN